MTANLKTFSSLTLSRLAEFACKDLEHANATQLLGITRLEPISSNVKAHYSVATQYTMLIMAARTLSEIHPEYDTVAARLLMNRLANEVSMTLHANYQLGFEHYIRKGIALNMITPAILEYDLSLLASKVMPLLESTLSYPELHNLAQQYLMISQGKCFEMPQYAFMRIAASIAKREKRDESRVVELYRLLSVRSYSRISPKTLKEGTTLQTFTTVSASRARAPQLKLVT